MLQHLSATSPYVCDLSRGPIEPANRMASTSTNKLTDLLEPKESISKTRTPLKLLGPEEVPADTTMASHDINASLQPVWYTEQTIVDDHHIQQEDNASMIQEKSLTTLTRSTLPPIPSESALIDEEDDFVPRQPSLMHKSSTFTIESPMKVDSASDDLEKENLIKDDPMPSMTAPSDESFRALEHLLGLGSATTTMRESPKPNHDTLSLTVVTPTDIINSTRRSSRLSFAQKTITDSLPSSQEIPIMETIESIASASPPSFLADNTTIADEQPSMTSNQQNSFDLTENNSKIDDESNFSFELNDFTNSTKNESTINAPEPTPPMITMRAPTCADVAYRALIKSRTNGRVSQPIKADSPLATTNKARSSAPASRFLRSSCRRISTDSAAQNSLVQEQTATNNECFINNEAEVDMDQQEGFIDIVSVPEEDEIEQEKSMSVTLNTKQDNTSNVNSPKQAYASYVNSPKQDNVSSVNTPKQINSSYVNSPKQSNASYANSPKQGNTSKFNSPKQRNTSNLNLSKQIDECYQSVASEQPQMGSPSQELAPLLSREYTYNTPKRRSSKRNGSMLNATTNATIPTQEKTINEDDQLKSPSITSKSMLNILLTQPTEQTILSPMESAVNSPAITSKSMLGVISTQNEERTSTRKSKAALTPVSSAAQSPSLASKSMLEVLLTKPTQTEQRVSTRKSKAALTPVSSAANSPSIVSKSMLGVLLTKPTQTEERRSTRNSKVLKPTPSVVSKSMLNILLTQPTDVEQTALHDTLSTSIKPSSQRASRGIKRLSANLTPRASINPLHSSTPSSTTRHKSLKMVSIGEQEQILTTVPTQQEIEIVQLDDSREESIRQSTPPSRTMDAGVQTTPSLNMGSRRYFDSLDQESPSLLEMNKSSSSVIVQEKQITPLQAKIIMNLKRNVRFQLTPTTDARLTEKEKLEETLRGLKPDIVINPTPVVAQVVKAEVKKPVKRLKKASKPKKKLLTRKKKTTATKKPIENNPQEVQHISPKKDSKTKVESTPSKKASQRKRASPEVAVESVTAKRSKVSKPTDARVASSNVRTASASNKTSKVESTKRQRSASKTSEKKKQKPTATKVDEPEPKQNASKTKKAQPKQEKPTPVKAEKPESKRAASKANKKNSPSTEIVAAKATAEPTKLTRSASANTKKTTSQPTEEKRSASTINETNKVEVIEPKRKSLKSTKKSKSEPQRIVPTTKKTESTERKRGASVTKKNNPVEPTEEKQNISIANKKTTAEPINKRQSRAQSRSANKNNEVVRKVETKPTKSATKPKKAQVEKKEVEKEKPIVQIVESNREQRQKFEELTVAELKSRLTKHNEDIPKGAKKADLIALLLKKETHLVKEQKSIEIPIVKTTRRHKK
ncbi:unnamed protein product [Rotaria magnacalcarata]|uniref:SAP domain-containing protein n=4 Tax=Rotaria magnacalcarata TaxID=392030 RepID=A0A816ZXH2_9BILA|nr:unnamed protein product [Rotaria magnacalcarata]